jgi:hypothetical protein
VQKQRDALTRANLLDHMADGFDDLVEGMRAEP